jgi:predicted nucleotidyltransferase
MRAQLLAAARRRGVSNLRVFGSVARGDDTAESDIDLLVDLDRARTVLDLIGFQQDAERILGMRVDAVAPRFMKERVRARAVRDARPV